MKVATDNSISRMITNLKAIPQDVLIFGLELKKSSTIFAFRGKGMENAETRITDRGSLVVSVPTKFLNKQYTLIIPDPYGSFPTPMHWKFNTAGGSVALQDSTLGAPAVYINIRNFTNYGDATGAVIDRSSWTTSHAMYLYCAVVFSK